MSTPSRTVPGFVNAHTHIYSALAPYGMPPASPPPENFVQIGLHGGRECLADKAVAEELGYRYYTMADVDELGIATLCMSTCDIGEHGRLSPFEYDHVAAHTVEMPSPG